jgi:myo-inositol-1(or 4)-monophosphatase
MYETELKIAKAAARQAGQFLKKEYNKAGRASIQYKTPGDTVTYCDKNAEKIIIQAIKKYFPGHTIISEEAGLLKKKSDYVWTIDPLDGTNNFVTHIPLFTTSIAMFYKNKVVLGVTYVPLTGEMYWASENNGAYKNNTKIKVSKLQTLSKMFISFSNGKGTSSIKKAFQIYKHFRFKAYRCRNYSCTTIQMAMTAAGYFDAYLLPQHNIWDIAAGIILAQEAGAHVTDWKNKPITIKSTSVVAANKKMHPVLLKELKKIKLA